MIALIGSSKKLTKQQLDCIATTMSALKKELVTERESVSFSLPAACLQVGNPKSINEYARKELDKFNNKY